jgi:TfoX/Sxy family transcriptional regulator of competence genes
MIFHDNPIQVVDRIGYDGKGGDVMEWKNSTPERVALLEDALVGIPCRGKSMFGCRAYFAADYMFTGVRGDDVYLRAAGAERDALVARYPGLRPFEPLPGRFMKDYVVLPEEAIGDRAEFVRILERAFGAAMALPPKPPKPPRAPKRPSRQNPTR